MDTTEIKKELHEYIDAADDRVLQLIYGMMQADKEGYEIPEWHKQLIEERIEDYERNPTNVISWDEVKIKIEKNEMNYSISLSLEAQKDLFDSIHWYNQERAALGFELAAEVSDKILQIQKNPFQYAIRYKNARAANLVRFPYLIYYRINPKEDTILIIGIFHTSRNPAIIRTRK